MTATTSLRPNLFAAACDRSNRPAGVVHLVPRFLEALRARGWVAGVVLSQELGVDLRTLADAAHESGVSILGGQRGYCLTIQEVTATVNRLYSQAREMRDRAMEIERGRHFCGVGSAA